MSFVMFILCIQLPDMSWDPGPSMIQLRSSAIAVVLPTIPVSECSSIIFTGGYRVAVLGTVSEIIKTLDEKGRS